MKVVSPALVGGLAGGAQAGGDLAPGVAGPSETGHGVLGGVLQLVGQGEEIG